MVWAVIKAMFAKASQGDVPAAKLILDRVCGLLEKPSLEVNVDNRQVHVGPEAPKSSRNFQDYLREIGRIAEKQGLLDDMTDKQLVERTAEALKEVEDLLQ